MKAERTINSLKSITGNLTMDPLEIEKKKHFKDFYELIYKSECTENRKVQNIFLDQLQFQTISEDWKIALDSPLTTEDLSEAIGDINSGKAHRPDELPVEFYKTFKRHLVRPFLDMYEESFIEGMLLDSLRLDIIT